MPLPVVAECDDQPLNDIQRRRSGPVDVHKLLDEARTGQFARGSVGAGTGMRAFGFKAGIGSASRVLPRRWRLHGRRAGERQHRVRAKRSPSPAFRWAND